MPTVPILQIMYRRLGDILFGWKPLLNTQVKYYNLYCSATALGFYAPIRNQIPNQPDKGVYRGKIIASVKDADIPIPDGDFVDPSGGLVQGTNYYFKLTFVDQNNAESNIALSDPILVRPAQIEPVFDNENGVQNSHEYGWVEDRKRWEKLQLTDQGKLEVDANVSVTLGNLQVAALTDNTTLEYLLVDNNRELIARIDPNSIVRIGDYEETAAVVKNVETVILTYTNVSDFFIEKVACSGTGDATYKFKINGTTYETLRTSWNNRNITFDFSTIARKIPANSTITVTSLHVEKELLNFESSLIGFTFTI